MKGGGSGAKISIISPSGIPSWSGTWAAKDKFLFKADFVSKLSSIINLGRNLLVTVSHFRKSKPDGERTLVELAVASELVGGVLLPERVSSSVDDPSIIPFILTTAEIFGKAIVKVSKKKKKKKEGLKKKKKNFFVLAIMNKVPLFSSLLKKNDENEERKYLKITYLLAQG